MNVSEKSDFELMVCFEAAGDNEVKWYRNNQLLEPSEECSIQTVNGTSTIKMHSVDKKKVGKYEVVIQSNNMIVKSGSSVKLSKTETEEKIEPPAFIRPLRPAMAVIGDVLLLQAEVVSSPCASFQWFVDTKDIAAYAKENKLQNVFITNRNNVSCLCIENVSNDFGGVITCRAENFAGSVSSSALVEIRELAQRATTGEAPVFTHPLEDTTVMDGEPIVLTCTVQGKPWPKVEWCQKGKPIQRAKDVTIARQESGICELCLKEAFPEMAGSYCCIATNEFGSASCECVVLVEGSQLVATLIIACIPLHGQTKHSKIIISLRFFCSNEILFTTQCLIGNYNIALFLEYTRPSLSFTLAMHL